MKKTLHYDRSPLFDNTGNVIRSGFSGTISCLGNCNECVVRFMCFTTKNKYNSLELDEWQWKGVSKL